ncbi:uncharacterized protein LY89DRAFT_787223 [Mollisia scopiformis]|uniref:Zn(2)-C6 fungal-type domain-containing protein n=1 Tax=Mollisia scopiformis TaxID=149040 RepID=A0A194WSD5_MOLSC|nr:uncharacterized protein LY89DRAFT_787223 [Mollisia scopiformis]KUJ10876.1 hypothetical protein LY89DRAFT_787223 [Mollisia scopiformis]
MAEGVEPEGAKRRRAFKPKTRTGCITCRIRRIKCDEAKPACLKCTSTGRKCDGYVVSTNDRTSKSPSPPRSSTPVVNNTVSRTSLPRMTFVPFQASKSELRAFRYFQQETIPEICGFYREEFWFKSVLQACHHNPAIRHAAIALGSLHEKSVDPAASNHSEDLIEGGFPLQQYNKSIQALLKPVPGSFLKPQQKVDVALITCILFACFDALRGHLGTVFDHIDGGVKILSELQNKPNSVIHNDEEISATSLFAPMSTLNVLFTRLDIQGSSMMGARRLRLVPGPAHDPLIETAAIPAEFYSFEEARESQDNIFRCWHLDFRRTLTNGAEFPFGEVPTKEDAKFLKITYSQKLEQWSETYERFLLANPEKRDLPADHMLQLLNTFIWIHADVDHAASAEDETTWDQYTTQFRQIVYHATVIIASTSFITQRKTLFSLDTMIISPLYFVGSRCRHPEIRRDAIACLYTANRQEGLWESRTLARVAQRVLEIEEEGMGILVDGTEIPAWKRISGVQPELHSDERQATIHYTSKPAEEGGLPVTNMKEKIEW